MIIGQNVAYRIVRRTGEIIGVNILTGYVFHFNSDAAFLFNTILSCDCSEHVVDKLCLEFGVPALEASNIVADFIENHKTTGLLAEGAIGNIYERPRIDIFSLSRAKASLEKYAATKLIPVAATIELTKQCGLDCVHCYISKYDRHRRSSEGAGALSVDNISRILDELSDAGVVFVKFTGGEMFLRDDAANIIELAHDRGFVIDILTSGASISDDCINRIARCRVGRVQMSLYSDNHHIHDRITRRNGSFYRTISSAKKIISRGINVEFVCVAMRSNIDSLDGVVKLAEEIGASHTISYPLSPELDGGKNPLVHQLNKDELMRVIERDYDKLRVLPVTDRPLCNAGRSRISISSEGDIYPCNNLPLKIGNITTDSIDSAWSGGDEIDLFRSSKFSHLKTIDGTSSAIVLMCPGENLLENGDYMVLARSSVDIADAFLSLCGTPARDGDA